jgi:subtilase family serine protease
MTVAIVDAYDDPHAESDLAVYRARFKLPACTTANGCFRKVNQAGQPGPYPAASTAWSREIALDVEMVSAVCPKCPILLVEANSASIDDLGASVDEAVILGARSVSNSYYAVEWAGETSEDAHYTHPGVAITVSSGDVRTTNDGGSSSGGDAIARRDAEPYYPAASPYVTAVGGTTLIARGASFTEKAWGNEAEGCSRYEPRPAFQAAICPTRSTVDVVAVGNPRTGASIYVSQAGGWVVAGGTSVGAAVIASAYALSGNPAGPAFSYAHPGRFHHIGGAGLSLASGLGSPDGVGGL